MNKNNDHDVYDQLKRQHERVTSLEKTKKTDQVKSQKMITIVLVVLAALTIGQSVYSYNALVKIKTSGGKTASAGYGGATGSAPLPSSLNNLPDMVGGC